MRCIMLLTVLALLAPGCRKVKVEEISLESATDGQVRIDGGDISLSSSAGTVSLAGKVPDDFPGAVPVYPGARVTLATRSTRARPAWSLAMVTGDDTDHVVAFYRSRLTGFTVVSDRTLGQMNMSVWQSAQLDVTLVIAQGADQETSISMTVASR